MPKRPDDSLRDPDEIVARAIPVSVRIVGAWSWRVIGVVVLAGVLSAVQFIARGAWKDDTPPPTGPTEAAPPPHALRGRRTNPRSQDVTTVG